MISIDFAVGLEDQVAVMTHPDRTLTNDSEVDALYHEIEEGCPRIKELSLIEGVYRCNFHPKEGLKDLHRLSMGTRGWCRGLAEC